MHCAAKSRVGHTCGAARSLLITGDCTVGPRTDSLRRKPAISTLKRLERRRSAMHTFNRDLRPIFDPLFESFRLVGRPLHRVWFVLDVREVVRVTRYLLEGC